MLDAGKLVNRVIESRGNFLKTTWDSLEKVPGGRRVFSGLIGRAAAYTGTIGAVVTDLRPGYARVEMRDRPSVRNHLRSVHAIALTNLAELTGNVAMGYSLPDDARFIVAGLSIEYVAKGRGTIVGECHAPIVRTSERREYEIVVVMRDLSDTVVARATLRTLVGPKKART
jgi:acyl-coenzyme A thioesterase PaaI-like protein